jgi:starch-binding outer membrane protein, SusD/RagB family
MKTILRTFRPQQLLGVALACLAAGSMYGCKDFLTQSATPQGTLDANTLGNKAGVEGNLIATYRALDWNGPVGGNFANAASNWVLGSVASDDAFKGSEASDQPAIDAIEFYDWGAAGAQGELNDKWRGMYEGVSRANATLRLLKTVVENAPTTITPTEANGIQGEATFLRARYHHEAWRVWGAIPYFREDDTDFRKANLSKAEALAEILKDIDASIGLLPATPRNGNKGRVTSWTAKAYKGRVLMDAGQFAAALPILRDVQQNGPYQLETSYDKVWTGFSDFANGPETVLAYQASANDGAANGNNANYGERLNLPHSGSHFGCCGFHQPTFTFVNMFQTDPVSGLPLAITSTAAGQPVLASGTWNSINGELAATCPQPGVPYSCTSSANMSLDPRLDWTVGRDGVPYKDWGKHDPSWIRSESYGGPYSPKKNAHEKASGAESTVGWTNTQLNSVNIHILRYADVLLLLAEAEVEAGGAAGLTNALAIVNQIRARAAQKAQGLGTTRADIAVALNDPSITWAKYNVGQYPAFTSQAQAREIVRTERVLELGMEGQRLFDLRRYNFATANYFETVLNAYVTKEKTRNNKLLQAQTVATKHEEYPIPQTQIDLTKASGGAGLTQNPGW